MRMDKRHEPSNYCGCCQKPILFFLWLCSPASEGLDPQYPDSTQHWSRKQHASHRDKPINQAVVEAIEILKTGIVMRQVCEQGKEAARPGLGLVKQHRPAQAAIKEEKNKSQPPSCLASRKLPGKPNKERHERKGDEHILQKKNSR